MTASPIPTSAESTLTLAEQVSLAFAEYETRLEGMVLGALHARRREALQRFLAAGVPSPRHEEYKYTPLKEVLNAGLELEHFRKNKSQTAVAWLRGPFAAKLKANVLTTVNGHYEPTASTILSPVHEVALYGAFEAESNNEAALDAHFGKVAVDALNPLIDLNTALSNHGIFIQVPAGKKVELPVVVYHLASARNGALLSQPRMLVVLGEDSSLDLTEVFDAAGDNPSTTNLVVEVVMGKGAKLNYTKVQSTKPYASLIDNTYIRIEETASAEVVTLTTQGKLVRNNLSMSLAGKNAYAGLHGLYLVNTGNLFDNHTQVRHLVPDCQSDELYKGVAAGKGSGVFNGKIYVAQDAQKTNAFQSNRNLLVSDDASVNTKPQLEIYADDVRCTHGCTVGQLDEESLFYLRSRGIGIDEARNLLLHAFAGEVVDKIMNPAVAAFVWEQVEEWLDQLKVKS